MQLVHHEGSTSIHIEVRKAEDGSLRVEGQDIGAAPLKFFGSDEYEYALAIDHEHLQDLSIALLRQLYTDDPDCVGKLRRLLKDADVPYDWWSRP